MYASQEVLSIAVLHSLGRAAKRASRNGMGRENAARGAATSWARASSFHRQPSTLDLEIFIAWLHYRECGEEQAHGREHFFPTNSIPDILSEKCMQRTSPETLERQYLARWINSAEICLAAESCWILCGTERSFLLFCNWKQLTIRDQNIPDSSLALFSNYLQQTDLS